MNRALLISIALGGLLTACPSANTGNTGGNSGNPATISSIALTCAPASVNVGATSACTATAKDATGTALASQPAFTFASSDSSKATVSTSGVVTGVAAGSSSITATSGGVTSNAVALTVNANNNGGTQTLTSIVLSCTPTSVAVAATSNCTATGKDAAGANMTSQPAFTFASSDTGKATVSAAGVVTGVAAGSSIITAKSGTVTSNAVAITVTSSTGNNTGNYTVTELPLAAGEFLSFPRALNNAGQVATGSGTKLRIMTASSSKDVTLPSGVVGGIAGGSVYRTANFPICMNATGQLAFQAIQNGGTTSTPMFYDGTNFTEINFGAPAGSRILVVGCTDDGTVIGTIETQSQVQGVPSGYTWKNGTASAITGTEIKYNSATAINNSGDVLLLDGISKAGTYTVFPTTQDPGGFAGVAINDNGMVVGESILAGLRYWTGTAASSVMPKPAGTPDPAAGGVINYGVVDLNNNGEILVRSKNPATGTLEPADLFWVYSTATGTYTQIQVPGYYIEKALDINDSGVILAKGTNTAPGSKVNAGMLLTPKP